MRISVIIPVYQAEATLLRCVKSVERGLEKLYSRYLVDGEVILVNDGATDHSGATCKALAKKYKNIIFISQKNKGVAAARNTGIAAAKGDFVAFVDADDAIEERYFMSLYSEMKADTALVISKPYKYTSDMQKTKPITGKEDKLRVIDTPWNAMDELFAKREMSAVWGKLFRKVYIQNGFNEELSILEDMCFLADYLSVCKGVVKIIPEKEYIYYMKEDSTISFDKFEMMKTAYNYVEEKMRQAGCKYTNEIKGKYLNHYAKNYLKLSNEAQESEKGQEMLKRYREEAKALTRNLHLNLTERMLYMGMITNPEFAGNLVKQGRNNMYKLNRTFN